jgi:hypothetical protein
MLSSCWRIVNTISVVLHNKSESSHQSQGERQGANSEQEAEPAWARRTVAGTFPSGMPQLCVRDARGPPLRPASNS